MNICIAEDTSYSNFFPLVYFRPVHQLRCGMFTLEQKLRHLFPAANVSVIVREYLADSLRESDPATPVNTFPNGDLWIINSRVLADKNLSSIIKKHRSGDCVFTAKGQFAAAFLTKATAAQLHDRLVAGPVDGSLFAHLPSQEVSCTLVSYPWDVVHHNADEIERDLLSAKPKRKKQIAGTIYPGAHLLNKRHIWIGKGSAVKPGAVLDAEKGPIIIGDNVTIMSNAVVEGPAFIGNSCLIKIGAKIYHSSIGEWCKIGGEVEAAIVQSYSNKQHEGFLGHAYLGSWVNIGADTNNSDLKNNYSSVKVELNGKTVDTKMQFVGLTMGDHSKTGINVMFDTGTIVGVSCNIYGAGLPPKFVPSFSWGSREGMVDYDLEKSLDTARVVMARRKVNVTPAYEALFRCVHGMTAPERTLRARAEQ